MASTFSLVHLRSSSVTKRSWKRRSASWAHSLTRPSTSKVSKGLSHTPVLLTLPRFLKTCHIHYYHKHKLWKCLMPHLKLWWSKTNFLYHWLKSTPHFLDVYCTLSYNSAMSFHIITDLPVHISCGPSIVASFPNLKHLTFCAWTKQNIFFKIHNLKMLQHVIKIHKTKKFA